jgi:hypothetical protein
VEQERFEPLVPRETFDRRILRERAQGSNPFPSTAESVSPVPSRAAVAKTPLSCTVRAAGLIFKLTSGMFKSAPPGRYVTMPISVTSAWPRRSCGNWASRSGCATRPRAPIPIHFAMARIPARPCGHWSVAERHRGHKKNCRGLAAQLAVHAPHRVSHQPYACEPISWHRFQSRATSGRARKKWQRIERGRIYVAPPDHHMTVGPIGFI